MSNVSNLAISAANASDEAKRNAFEAGREAFLEEVRVLGVEQRATKVNLFKVAMAFQGAVAAGFVQAETSDAKKAYMAYLGEEQADTVGVDKQDRNERSISANTSDLLSFGYSAAVHAGEALYVQVDSVIKGYASVNLPGSKMKCYAKANRVIQKLLEEKRAQHDSMKVALEVTMQCADDAFFAAHLIKEGATKEGEETEGETKEPKAKATPVEKLALAQKAIAALVKSEYASDAELVRISAHLTKALRRIQETAGV